MSLFQILLPFVIFALVSLLVILVLLRSKDVETGEFTYEFPYKLHLKFSKKVSVQKRKREAKKRNPPPA